MEKTEKNTGALRARLILDTVFPLMEDYRAETAGLRIFGNVSLPVRVCAEAEGLEWKTGDNPLLDARFRNLDEIGGLMKGAFDSMPVLDWKPGGGAGAAAAGLTACLAAVAALPLVPHISRGSRTLRARLLMNAVSYIMNSVAGFDKDVHDIIECSAGDVTQFGVEPDGPFFYLAMNPGKFETFRERHPAPGAELLFRNLDVFDALVSGKLDPMKAYSDKDIRIEGESVLILMACVLLNRAAEYLIPGYAV